MFFHQDTKFAISIFDESTLCVAIEGLGQFHFDIEAGSLSVVSDDHDFSIHELAALMKGTEGNAFHEDVMGKVEEEAHSLNSAYGQYRSRLN